MVSDIQSNKDNHIVIKSEAGGMSDVEEREYLEATVKIAEEEQDDSLPTR